MIAAYCTRAQVIAAYHTRALVIAAHHIIQQFPTLVNVIQNFNCVYHSYLYCNYHKSHTTNVYYTNVATCSIEESSVQKNYRYKY